MAKENKFYLTTMVGTRGRVVSALNPEGIVRIHGELWQAITVDPPINPGEEITVVEHEGLMLTAARYNDAGIQGSH